MAPKADVVRGRAPPAHHLDAVPAEKPRLAPTVLQDPAARRQRRASESVAYAAERVHVAVQVDLCGHGLPQHEAQPFRLESEEPEVAPWHVPWKRYSDLQNPRECEEDMDVYK